MTHPPIEVDPEVGVASTPPASLYTDEAIFAALRERAFARSWQWIDAPPLEPAHACPVELLGGLLDAPLVVTRDADGVERCLSNVCTHRGYLVCRAPGATRGLRCGYHGRRFGLDGSLEHMPAFEDVTDFPAADDDLARRPLRRLGPLAFTALETPPDFDAWIGFVRERVGWLPLERFRADPDGTRSYDIAASWILYCENYLEGFHIPFVHAGLNEVLEFGEYKVELFPSGTLQVGVAKPGEPCFEPPAGSPEHGQRVAAYYAWLFPNLMLNFYPWGLSLNAVVPLGPARTRVEYRRWVWRPELLARGAGADLHRVELEDEMVVEGVQRGVRSRLYRRGRYSPRHERGTHHFHRLLAGLLAEP